MAGPLCRLSFLDRGSCGLCRAARLRLLLSIFYSLLYVADWGIFLWLDGGQATPPMIVLLPPSKVLVGFQLRENFLRGATYDLSSIRNT